jgi:hypothetical protein
MSKEYTEVKGYCPAGCARPVVSKEEFDDTKVIVVDKNGNRLKLVIEIDEETGDVNFKTEPLDTSTE